MLPSYFDYIFVHLRQKVRLRPELSPKFLSTLGPNPARTRTEKPGPTYNSAAYQIKSFILAVFRRSVKRVGGAHLRVIGPGQHSFFRRYVAKVESRWQHCVQFDRPEVETLDLPLQKGTRYRSTN